MQAEWGKGKKREKKEGKVEQQKDSGRFGRVLITFRIVDFRRTKTEGLEQEKAQAVNLGLVVNRVLLTWIFSLPESIE